MNINFTPNDLDINQFFSEEEQAWIFEALQEEEMEQEISQTKIDEIVHFSAAYQQVKTRFGKYEWLLN